MDITIERVGPADRSPLATDRAAPALGRGEASFGVSRTDPA